jgi:exodeoxyribonuclease VII small subunit
MAKKDKSTEPGFEEALKRLEALVEKMEAGDMDLDAMVGSFEEGQKLIQVCTRRLDEVEKRIETLVKNTDGTETTAPFDPTTAEDA